MTLGELNKLCKSNNIPDNVKLMSDSGWECCETEMNGVYYSEELNMIIFTQDSYEDTYIGKGFLHATVNKGIRFRRLNNKST